MSKQSFTTGQVLTAAQVNSLQANDFNQTVSVKTANYTLAAADKGTRIEFNTSGSVTCTVNSGLFDAGDTLVIQNRGAGTATITAGTATVNTSASLALSQYSAGTIYFVSDSAALFFGDAAGISASIVDAKGDLIVGTADNTVARLAVGTDGHTLVADSSTATGLAYAAPAGISWTTWTPSYSNLTIGNGTVVARYAYSGGLVILQWQLTWGSTSSFTGAPSIGNLPYNPKNRGAAIGYLQAANVNRPWFVAWSAAASTIQLYAFDASGTYAGQTALSNSIPGSWSNAPGDFLGIYAVYEAN